MTIQEIKTLIQPYTDDPTIHFKVEKQIFLEKDGRKVFNETIRQNVEKRFGVYIWVDTAANEIVYIGMAGKIKTDGTPVDHSVQQRLLASKGKDKATNRNIQTNDYIYKYMVENDAECLDFYIMYSKNCEPPAYIEALLLYKFYKKNNRLPKLNNSF